MSADLLAEFGGGSTEKPTDQSTSKSPGSFHASSSLFDDFEPAGNSHHARSSVQAEPQEEEFWSDFHSAKAPVKSPSPEAQDEELWHQDNFGNDVLFDATTEEIPDDDDDDWGEFESAEPAFEKQVSKPVKKLAPDSISKTSKEATNPPRNNNIAPGVPPSVDLLSDIDTGPASNPLPVEQAKPTHVKGQRNSNNSSQRRRGNSIDNSTPKLPDLDDEWGDFADAPEAPSDTLDGKFDQMRIGGSQASTTHTGRSPGQSKSQRTPAKHSTTSSVDIRPVNIPPPFVILQIFAPLFEQFREKAAGAKSAQDDSKQKSPQSNTILAGDLVTTLKVGARVIAGRTQRWKRDTALSQSMKIGPARSGKPGGMKLNSVNKSESVKEEKEAMDVLEAWRSHAGVFNPVILSAGYQVPLVSNNMQAKPASANEGALKASHACALCGLKREERIPKIDEKVEDSFGEWWTEHWGHTDCKDFWDKNLGLLNQRC